MVGQIAIGVHVKSMADRIESTEVYTVRKEVRIFRSKHGCQGIRVVKLVRKRLIGFNVEKALKRRYAA